ncbi:hypothetical protein L2E82_30638 [Cichorium intybus]|uniref:Uncharacterized protein n=1 Tax=Cichorium intybus TaxID=13427 RepID=A0ACB9D0V8_CICIN|nr:hypothetical protein L2E82_30638 [Cichorium intybus]
MICFFHNPSSSLLSYTPLLLIFSIKVDSIDAFVAKQASRFAKEHALKGAPIDLLRRGCPFFFTISTLHAMGDLGVKVH